MTRSGAPTSRPRFPRAAAAFVGVCAAYQLILGAYFVVFRPSLLPEDLRFLGATVDGLTAELPRLEQWLKIVFVVLGGQMAALGVLLAVFALRLARRRPTEGYELILLGVAGGLSVALMAAMNFALGSDFRWVLLIPVLAWSVGVALAALTTGAATVQVAERRNAG